MSYQPIKIIAVEQTTDGKVNRETTFDDTPLSNKLCYQTGFPYLTASPDGQNSRGPRRVDLNGLFYLFSSNLFELQQGNFPTYNATIVGAGKPLPSGYPLGAVLWYPTGGYFVRSLIADNTESDLTDTTKWAKITISAADLATGLSGKVDLASGVAQADVDYVTESYVNGTSWYRIYKSGWCEQGGMTPATSGANFTSIAFLQEFADTNYSFVCHGEMSVFIDGDATHTGVNRIVGTVYSRSAAGVVVYSDLSYFQETYCWQAKGYLAQED